jgi:hypothetical protein
MQVSIEKGMMIENENRVTKIQKSPQKFKNPKTFSHLMFCFLYV